MTMSSVSSEEFSFPLIASQDSCHGTDSPPLWKHSPEKRALAKDDDNNYQTKSFSYMERKNLWSDRAEERMDMLWEVLNEELPPRSQSLRIGDDGGERKTSLFSDEKSSAVAVGCGLKLTKKTAPKKKMSTPNVLMLMRVLKKILVMRSTSRRSPAKTHPR